MSERATLRRKNAKTIPISRVQVQAQSTAINKTRRGQEVRRASGANIPLVDGLLILLIRFDKPLADANEAAIHEAALQQVVDGFEQQRATFVGKAVLP